MGLCCAYIVGIIPPFIWQCTPIPFSWTFWSGDQRGKCLQVNALAWAASSINVVLDVAVIVVPIPELFKLSLTRKKKIQIISMFCVGFL